MKTEHQIALGAAALGAVGAAVAYAVLPQLPYHGVLLLRETSALVPSMRERLVAAPGEWRALPAPSHARQVPLIAPQRTPFPDERAMNFGRGTFHRDPTVFRAALTRMRELLRAVGRGDEDPRCALWLPLKETRWGKASWGGNLGNRKATRATYASPDSIRAGHVWTTNPWATAVHSLVDRVRSLDLYNSFSTFEDSLRDEARFFVENSHSPAQASYAHVLPAYRQGGLDGLKAAIGAMHDGGYSPGIRSAKLIECEQYWRMGERACGAEWVR